MNPKLRLARLSCGIVFFLNGFGLANWAARIPDVRRQHGLSDAELGFALLFMAVGSLIGIPLAGRLVGRYGSRRVSLGFGVVFAVVLALVPFASTSLGLFATLFALGASNGGLDVAMNAQAIAIERAYSRPILSGFHALWSVGGLLGASLAGFLAEHGIPYSRHLLWVGLVLSAWFLIMPRLMLTGDAERTSSSRKQGLKLTRPLLLLGVVAFCGLVTEGAVADWSAVYLRDSLQTGPGFAALGYAAFQCSMAAVRFFGDGLRDRFGEGNVVRASGTLVAVGLGSALIIGQPTATVIGFALVGAGAASIFPVAMSAAGRLRGVSRGSAIAWLSTFGYTGFLAGPPIIGLSAQSFGLRVALCTVVLAGIVIASLSSAADPSVTDSPAVTCS
jgi:MFS family permease